MTTTTATMTFFQTSVGKKVVMAVTGLVMIGFVLGHMLGNLQIFIGAQRYDHYAAFLQSLGEVLWAIRLVLLTALVLHVTMAIQLWFRGRAARPVKYYKGLQYEETTIAARTMIWAGIMLALYIVYHLLHFTIGSALPGFEHGHVYHNVVVGFGNPIVSVIYIVAMFLLALHIYHGGWSLLQTLGVSHPRINPLRKPFAAALAVVIFIGFSAVPMGVLTGIIK